MKGLALILTTRKTSLDRLYETAVQAILGGIDSLQFRHKGVYTQEVYHLADKLSILCQQANIPMLVNDRFDIALGVNAAGVHLGQTDLPLARARLFLGATSIIGLTASTVDHAKRAEQSGADYVGFGHIFPTSTKAKDYPPVGLKVLEEVCRTIHIPVVAVGGINELNLGEVLKTGVKAVAIAASICCADNPLAQTKTIKTIILNFRDSYG